jgi:Tfp pilus assembly protein PilV
MARARPSISAGVGGRCARWNRAGFSLVETLVAAGLLALGLMPLAYMQTNGFRTGVTSYSLASGSALALQLAETVRNVPYEDERLGATSGYVQPDGTLTNSNPLAPNGSTWTACAPDKCGYKRLWRITAESPIAHAKTIDIQVTWRDFGTDRNFVLSIIKAAGS